MPGTKLAPPLPWMPKMRSWRAFPIALLVLSMPLVAFAQRTPLRSSFDLRVPWTPQPVVVAGKTSLVYELHLTNYAQDALTLRRIDVVDDQQHPLLTLSGDALVAAIGRTDRAKGEERLNISPGNTAVAYLTVPRDDARAVHLEHRVFYATSSSHEASVGGGAVTSIAPAAAPLGPPLRGGPWVAIHDDTWERGHRRVLYAIGGAVKVPGRFAIDWIRVGERGGFAKGGGETPQQWLGYGADVLAVADATVASVGSGVTEPATLAEGAAHKVPLEDAAGNYVALDLGDGRFAFYEHLKPDSITVKAGQRVKRGEVIGKLGYTGESTGPHLHFHVSDANAPLDAEGLPYALSAFRVGAYSSIKAFADGDAWTRAATPAAERGFPAPLSVVDFDDAH